jgi:hypothetical protein
MEHASIDFTVPDNLAPGKYILQIMGAQSYQAFVNKMAPQKFKTCDLVSHLAGLRHLMTYRRDRLYAVMTVPSTGLVFRQHELGNLPPTKMLLMQDSKRLAPLEPWRGWAENCVTIDKIVQGAAQIELIVEQRV